MKPDFVELDEHLKDHLKITVRVGAGPSGDPVVVVQLLLDGEVISEASDSLPEVHDKE
jgi:hypothetical protein